jgi:hypothetical protein
VVTNPNAAEAQLVNGFEVVAEGSLTYTIFLPVVIKNP